MINSYTNPYLFPSIGGLKRIDLLGRFETVVLSNVLEHIENKCEFRDRL